MDSSVRLCPMCDYCCPSFQLFVSHLRLVHSTDSTFSVLCGIEQCTDVYRSFAAFNSHVYRKHRVALGLEKPFGCSEIPVENQFVPNTTESTTLPSDHDEQQVHLNENDITVTTGLSSATDTGEDVSERIKKSAEFLLTLSEGRQLSQVALNDVIKGCRSICDRVVSQVKEEAFIALKDAGIDPVTVPQLFAVPDPFETIDTPHLREKFYKEHFNYIVSPNYCYTMKRALNCECTGAWPATCMRVCILGVLMHPYMHAWVDTWA